LPGRTQCPPLRRTFSADLLASLVVFLVALPLCLGIAIASGVPPALGLITGIVGGLVVGLLQVVAGLGRSGRWFRAVPPALIHGMLAGIGVLIVASQAHVMVDDDPSGHGLENLIRIPAALVAIFRGDARHTEAALIGLLTISALLAWRKFAPGRLRSVPATLVGVGVATLVANAADLPIARVDIPSDVFSAGELFGWEGLRLLGRLETWSSAFGLAVVASAETLLCIGAVDRLAGAPSTDYDRELRAQGVGNTICGLLGALPMTAVIVRSSTNLQAGARTRASTVLHGVWLLTLVALAPWVLRYVAVSSLAAVLVFTGWKLIDRTALAELRRQGGSELVVYAVTLAAIVATDLLIGIIVGVIVDWEALRRARAGGDADPERATGSLAPTVR
jgi:MFS superfamily sulfate permease-like transporter